MTTSDANRNPDNAQPRSQAVSATFAVVRDKSPDIGFSRFDDSSVGTTCGTFAAKSVRKVLRIVHLGSQLPSSLQSAGSGAQPRPNLQVPEIVVGSPGIDSVPRQVIVGRKTPTSWRSSLARLLRPDSLPTKMRVGTPHRSSACGPASSVRQFQSGEEMAQASSKSSTWASQLFTLLRSNYERPVF